MFPAEFERRYRGRRGFIENDRGLTNTPELLAGENPHDEFHAEKLRAGRDDVRTRMTTNNLSEIYELNKGGYAMSAREYLKRPSLRSLPARRRVGGVLKDNA